MTVEGIWSELKPLNVINRKAWLTVGLAVLAMTATMVSQTNVSQIAPRANRITQSTTSGTSVMLAGTVHPRTKVATDLGSVESDTPMDSMRMNIGLSAAQKTELNALLKAQQNPQSPQYHKWLTQEQYGARFGLTDSDLNAVTSWLKSQGFTVKSVAPSRNVITFSGTAGQAEAAFQTQLHRYELDGETRLANATELRLPAALASVVTNVSGLSSFRPKPHSNVKRLNPDLTSHLKGGHYLTPGDWATIYDVLPIYGSYTGTGMHVGVLGQTYFPTSDVDLFRAAAGLSATKLNMVCISATHCTDTTGESIGDMGEADLDVEWAGGVAKDATVDFIYASASDQNNDVISALIYAISTYQVNGAVVPVLSLSYGNCESEMVSYASERSSVDSALAQAALQGQTVLNSSGDTGAAGCDASSTKVIRTSTLGASASWPASSPLVTGVGGTRFSGDEGSTYAGTYWSGNTTADVVVSALSYIPETSWNDTTSDEALSSTAGLSSSGGGVSQFYSLPSWQTAPSNFSGTQMRFVPDVAFSASADHDQYLVCTQEFSSSATSPTQTLGTSCVNGLRYSDTTFTGFGGTSAGTPSFAGMLTLMVQKYGLLGNINSKLYSLASNPTIYASAFHDITTGSNIQPCSTGTGCLNGQVGYSALTGYDLVTGLGSVDGNGLFTALGNTLATTTTTVSASPNSVTLGDTTSLSLAAKVTSTTPGTIGQYVLFQVNGVTFGKASLAADGTATLSNVAVTAAKGFSVGSDTITATFSGDGTYSLSSTTTPLTVVAPPTYTLAASSNSLTTSGTVTLTLATSNFTGNVTLVPVVTSTNGTASNVTATLSAASVPLAGSGSATSTLTISVGANAANHAPAIPWKGGGALVFAVVLGAPFTVRRKRALAVLLTAAVISLAGLMVACGGSGGGSSSSGSTTPVKTARTYTVTVTPTGSGSLVTNPSAVQITVTVQ